jgi:hypothetical protein
MTRYLNGKPSPEYRAWLNMKSRCFSQSYRDRHRYSGRGITVCQEWVESYEAFYQAVGPRPGPGYSLDRYPDNNGNYEPGNVRWATKKEQSRNRHDNHLLTFEGQTKPLTAWAEERRVEPYILFARIQAWGPVERALTEPVMSTTECAYRSRVAWKLKTHCKHGHEFTPENTYIFNNSRHCRACRRRTGLAFRHAQRHAATEVCHEDTL